MTHENPNIGEYEAQRDGSYRLYVGGNRGWILCDDHAELIEELNILERSKRESKGEK